jgi:hypothetical protein
MGGFGSTRWASTGTRTRSRVAFARHQSPQPGGLSAAGYRSGWESKRDGERVADIVLQDQLARLPTRKEIYRSVGHTIALYSTFQHLRFILFAETLRFRAFLWIRTT